MEGSPGLLSLSPLPLSQSVGRQAANVEERKERKGKMRNQRYFKFLSLVLLSLQVLFVGCAPSVATTLPTTRPATSIEYWNTEYGFSFSLPASWKGYSIITDTWQGYTFNGQSDVNVEQGPMISIRHPQWTSENPRQDIPIWVFTVAQWNSLQQGNYSVSAGGITTDLGRNAKYVFALPARYNVAEPTGYEEVETILAGNPFHTP
jgi:hypothetical protein